MFLSRSPLDPPIEALDIPHVVDGIAHMRGLVCWIDRGGETAEWEHGGNRVTVYCR